MEQQQYEVAGSRIRILLVHHQKLAREGLQSLIEREPDMVLVGHTHAPEEAYELVRTFQPDVVLLDMDMAGLPISQALAEMRRLHPSIKLVGMSETARELTISRALAARMNGFAMKQDGFALLRETIRAAYRGEQLYARSALARIVPENGDPSPGPESRTRLELLTRRERQLLRLLASGLSLKKACGALDVSYKTADKHKASLMKKLDIHDRVELARFAIREKIVEP